MTEIRVDVDLPHPPARVWRALTEARIVTDWVPTAHFVVTDDGHFTVRATDLAGLEDQIEGELLNVEPPHRMAMRWEAPNLHTVVSLTLLGTESGCRLTLTQSGFLGPSGTMRRRVLRSTYTRLFEGPLAATLDRVAAEEAREARLEAEAPPQPEPEPYPPRNDGGPFQRFPRQPRSASAPGLGARVRAAAGPKHTPSMPGFGAAVLGAQAAGPASAGSGPAPSAGSGTAASRAPMPEQETPASASGSASSPSAAAKPAAGRAEASTACGGAGPQAGLPGAPGGAVVSSGTSGGPGVRGDAAGSSDAMSSSARHAHAASPSTESGSSDVRSDTGLPGTSGGQRSAEPIGPAAGRAPHGSVGGPNSPTVPIFRRGRAAPPTRRLRHATQPGHEPAGVVPAEPIGRLGGGGHRDRHARRAGWQELPSRTAAVLLAFGRATRDRLAGWSPQRRSQAFVAAAALLLLLALLALLIGRATAPHRAAPPQVGGAPLGPAEATLPGQDMPRASSVASAHALAPTASPAASGARQPPGTDRSGGSATSPLTGAYRTEEDRIADYTSSITINNPTATPVQGWTAVITLPLLDLVVRDVEGAVASRSGDQVTFTPVEATRTVAAGGFVRVRFQVAGLRHPTGCTVDRNPCSGL